MLACAETVLLASASDIAQSGIWDRGRSAAGFHKLVVAPTPPECWSGIASDICVSNAAVITELCQQW